jgi:sigma-B regulation protein RsbU (phosphoserine phosphatase)
MTLSQGNPSLMFVTLLIAVFDGATNRLTYVRAGHVPPFLRRRNGIVERLEAAGGVPLGIIEDATYESAIVELLSGDELLIVTDGITEAMDPAQELFGEDRVLELMASESTRGGIVLQHLFTQVRAFEAGGPQSDDIAAILMRLEK